ncbi:hypothetical protein CLOSBL3_11388 [Clostridiaceae bacterium BL-3]|nr:hypothetical protein CLOSBL3_11388 [Clostridiaceae bacterium BL-3]
MLRFSRLYESYKEGGRKYLNTSHVKVQLKYTIGYGNNSYNLNTSHVKVQPF